MQGNDECFYIIDISYKDEKQKNISFPRSQTSSFKNNNLSNILPQFIPDSNRFGTKMLEKMGWSKGKGLGANLDGQLDFIKVSHKGDQKGVGFKDRDDQWTTHESNFSSLLNSFKSTENSDEESQDCAVQRFQSGDKIPKKENVDEKEEHFSGVSLEEQSKNSRARVHYKKFTRGKDLSRYSEKDLANIFGRKSLKSNVDEGGSTGESNEDEKSENTPNFGITTIVTGTTINDYFKSKMKNANNDSKKSPEEHVNNVENVPRIEKEKKSRKKSKAMECASQNPVTGDEKPEIGKETAVALPSEQISLNESKKRKHDNIEVSKSSKKKKSVEQVTETLVDDLEKQLDKQTLSATKKLKKKKEKACVFSEGESVEKTDKTRNSENEASMEENFETVNDIIVKESDRPKKKKSRKGDGIEESDSTRKTKNETVAGNGFDVEKARPHKKSKRDNGNKQIDVLTIPTDQQSTNLFDYVANIADEEKQNVSEVVTDNIYEIRRYRTEIFRYVDLQGFPGSTLYDIPGYGYTSEMTLKIVDKGDENRLINTMWNEANDKYAHNGKMKKKKFVEHIGDLKKKNIFKF